MWVKHGAVWTAKFHTAIGVYKVCPVHTVAWGGLVRGSNRPELWLEVGGGQQEGETGQAEGEGECQGEYKEEGWAGGEERSISDRDWRGKGGGSRLQLVYQEDDEAEQQTWKRLTIKGCMGHGHQQRLLFHVEAGQDDYIQEICSPEGLILNPARLKLDWSALLLHSNQKEWSSLIVKISTLKI